MLKTHKMLLLDFDYCAEQLDTDFTLSSNLSINLSNHENKRNALH